MKNISTNQIFHVTVIGLLVNQIIISHRLDFYDNYIN